MPLFGKNNGIARSTDLCSCCLKRNMTHSCLCIQRHSLFVQIALPDALNLILNAVVSEIRASVRPNAFHGQFSLEGGPWLEQAIACALAAKHP